MSNNKQLGGVWKYAESQRLIPEANIQAEFYYRCRTLSLNCVLEYHTPAGRLDIAMLDNDATHLLAIVECKSDEYGSVNLNSRQIQRYRKLGVEVYGLGCLADVEYLVNKINSIHFGSTPPAGIRLTEITSIVPIPRRIKRRKIAPEWDEDLNIRYD